MKTFVSLYWRRRRGLARPAPRPATPQSPPAPIVSIHQHFHDARRTTFVTTTTAARPPRTTLVFAPAASLIERIVSRRVIEARPLDAAGPIAALERIVQVGTANGSAARSIDPSPAQRADVTVSPNARRSPAAPSGVVSPVATRPSVVHNARGRRKERRSRSPLVPRPAAGSTTRPAVARHLRSLAQPRSQSRSGTDAVSIEWRKPQLTLAAAPRPAASQPGVPHPPASPAQATTADTSSQAPRARSAAAAAAAGAVSFDAPTMERLADNVLKRIERRVRIERERRGL